MKKNTLVFDKIKFSEMLFFTAYGLFLLINILNISFFQVYTDKLTRIVYVFCLGLLIFKELLSKKIKMNDFFLWIIMIVLFLLVLIHSNGSLLIMIILLYGARNIKFEKLAKFTIKESLILLILIILSAKFGLIINYVLISGTRTRKYLGFRYALYPQMLLFNITALDLYLHRNKASFSRSIFWIIINYWLYHNTDARLSFYLAVILILFMFILAKFPNILNKRKLLCFGISISFIICSIFSLVLIYNYDSSNATMRKINEIFGNRLYLCNKSLSIYPLNLFGHDTEYIGNGLDMYGKKNSGTYLYVDNLYLNIAEKYGIIFTILFIALLTNSMFKAWKDNDYYLLIILAIIALHGVIDDLAIYLYYNTFWFIISKYASSNFNVNKYKYKNNNKNISLYGGNNETI
jgi:hypothetical protein